MRVSRPLITESPKARDKIRIQADLECNHPSFPRRTFWFDVPEMRAPQLTRSGNPWLALMAPLAINLGEPLQIEAPVDALLLSNIRELISIWSCWYLSPIEIEAKVADPLNRAGQHHVALFSGGGDSWFTLLRHLDGQLYPQVGELLTILGWTSRLTMRWVYEKCAMFNSKLQIFLVWMQLL